MKITKEEILEILNKYEIYLIELDSEFGMYAVKRNDFNNVAKDIIELIKKKEEKEK